MKRQKPRKALWDNDWFVQITSRGMMVWEENRSRAGLNNTVRK